MYNTYRTSVAERQRDIGMLRAVGARRKTVMRAILYEGLILAVLGTVVGMLLGVAFAYGARTAFSNMMESLMGSSLGPPRFDALTFIVTILFGLGQQIVRRKAGKSVVGSGK